MGTDFLGRDVLSRIIHGSRISVYVGVVATLLGTLLGVPLGLVAGFYGGRIDNLIMRLMDVLLAFPIFLLAIVIMVILTPVPPMWCWHWPLCAFPSWRVLCGAVCCQ